MNLDFWKILEYEENLRRIKVNHIPPSPGNAVYTCKNEGRKSFGVGYVSDLGDFERQVEQDLKDAINEYFLFPDTRWVRCTGKGFLV